MAAKEHRIAKMLPAGPTHELWHAEAVDVAGAIIQNDNVHFHFQEFVRHMRADQAGTAGHKSCFHDDSCFAYFG